MVPDLHIGRDELPDAVSQAMFAARKSVFIDLLRWELRAHEGRYEVDQFDTPTARYLVLAKDDHSHLGSARLLPTTAPHILDSFYAELCDEPPPCGPHVVEVSRFCLDRSLRAEVRRDVRDTLVTALAHHALACGITSYSAIAELGWAEQILTFGWQCTSLGAPRRIGGRLLCALRIDIADDTPARLRAGGIVAAPLADDLQRAA